MKIFVIIISIIAILVLLRVGALVPAGAISTILFVAALAEKLMRMHYMRKSFQQGARGKVEKLSAGEAREMLGVAKDADAKEIKAAYKKLMGQLHPDKGGNDYLAAKLNEAKDILLKENRK